MAIGAQGPHDALLVQRRQLGKHLVCLDDVRQRAVAHAFDLRAEQHGISAQSDLGTDALRDEFVVTGQHLHRDAVVGQRLQGRGCRLFRRVEDGDIPDQCQPALVGDRIRGLARGNFLHRHRHHAQPIFIEFASHLLHAHQHVGVQRQFVGTVAVLDAHAAAHGQHLLDRALADQLVVVVALRHHHRHATAFEVEGHLVDLAIVLLQFQLGLQLDVLEHGAVEQVLWPRLVVAVQERELEHLFRLVSEHVGVALQSDLVLRQRAGLVGTQDVRCAEVLDRIQTLHDHFLA